MMLYTSENDLELTDKYTSTADIPDANIDPALIGTWKTADGSMAYTFHDDGTAKASMERYGDNEFTFTCFVCDDYNLIAQDTEMTDYSNDEEKTIPVVSYSSYKVENDVLYFTVVESVSEYMNQSITQIVVLYKADENGDITSAVNKNPVSLASFYGEWTYGENEDGKFVIDENGFALDGGKAIPIAYNELGKLVIGDMNNVTEYSTGLGLERLYDNTNGLELTGENYVLAVDDDNGTRHTVHVFDPAEEFLQFFAFTDKTDDFFLRQQIKGAVFFHPFQIFEAVDTFIDGFPVGQGAAEPAVIDVVFAAAFCFGFDAVLCLLLCADE